MVDVRPSVLMSSLTPERVAHADFGSSFRGFDPTEVRGFLARVAGELRALHERDVELSAYVAELEQHGGAVDDRELDEHRVTEWLGAETARVLEAARDAAATVRSNADQQAAALLASAEADAAEMRPSAEAEASDVREAAEALLADRSTEAEAEAARLRAAGEDDLARAKSDAEEIRQQARDDAEARVGDAREEGRRMVAEARAVRERILTDMARRRNQGRQQLERLRAGRERLLEAVEVVRRAVESASGELNDSLVEAKLAGERAARQVDLDVLPSMAELEAEVELAKDAELIDRAAIEREVLGTTALDEAVDVDVGDDVQVLAGDADENAGGDTAASYDVAPGELAGLVELVDAPLTTAATAEDPLPGDDPSTDMSRRIDVDSTDLVSTDAVSTDAVSTDVSQRIDVESPSDPPSEELVGQLVGRDDDEDDHDDHDHDHDDHDGDDGEETPAVPARRAGFSHAVEDLFSRWKQVGDSEGPASVDSAAEAPDVSLAAAATADADAEGGAAAGAEPEPEPEPAVAPAPVVVDARAQVARHTRDAVLAGIGRDLSRHLKLALSDEQNVVLERLRDTKAKGDTSEFLDELAAVDRYRGVIGRELIGALEAGWRTVRVDEDGLDPSLLDPVADEATDLLVRPVHERVASLLGDRPEGEDALERIRNLYREVRNERAGQVAEHAALTAFAAGQYAAAGRLGSSPRGDGVDAVLVRWAFDGCVPDCYDNSLAGPLALGDLFPTEHQHPPAFVGCRCLLVVERSDDVLAGAEAPGRQSSAELTSDEPIATTGQAPRKPSGRRQRGDRGRAEGAVAKGAEGAEAKGADGAGTKGAEGTNRADGDSLPRSHLPATAV